MIDIITFIMYNVIMLLSCVMWYQLGKSNGKLEILNDELETLEFLEKTMKNLSFLSNKEETSIKGNGK